MIALSHLDLQTLAQVPAASLLNSAVEGTGIALLAWMLLRVTGRQNSGTRFAVWFFALLSIAALPLAASWTPHAVGGAGSSEFMVPSSWAVYFLAGWAVISGVCFARLGVGLWQIRRLRSACADVDLSILSPDLRRLIEDSRSVRRVKLCVSGRVNAPAAVGFFRPAIVIPPWGLTELSPDELKVTVLHELAHLRRWDDWTNLVQKAVRAVFFFHPAVWWIEGRLALEREMACDDLVLAQTANPKAYAASLISFAERIHRGRELALVHAVVGRVRQISRRVTRILDNNRPSATQVWKPVVGLVTLLSGAALVVFPYAPRLVAFRDSSPVMTETAHRSAVELPTVTQESSFKPNVVQAAMKMSTSSKADLIPAKRKVRAATPRRVMLANTVPQQIPLSEATFVMQAVQLDAQGLPVLTTCFWRVTQDSKGHKTVETTYFVRKI